MKYFVEPQCSKQKKAIAVLIEVGSVVNRSSVLTYQVTHLKNVFRISVQPLLVDPDPDNSLKRRKCALVNTKYF